MKIRNHILYFEELKRVLNSDNINWDLLDKKHILLIGGTGLIGQSIVDLILCANHEKGIECTISVTGRNESRARLIFGDEIWENPFFNFMKYDVSQEICLEKGMGVDYLIYAASNTHPIAYATDPVGTILTNIIGLDNALKFSVESNVKKFIFLSSVEIYGESLDQKMFKESSMGYIDSNTLRAGYPESKRTGEALCQAYLSKYGIDVVIARLSRVYGPTVLPTDTKASTQFLKNAINGRDIILKSSGSQLFSYTYTPDASSAILCLLQLGVKGEAYNIKSKNSDITLKNLAECLASMVNREVKFDLPSITEQAGFSKATVATLDASKLSLLGWKSEFDIQEGISNTVKILMATDNDLKGDKII